MKTAFHKPAPPAERILAAADKLFYRQGIRAVGVDAVAAEAAVSKRTLYNYYPSKDDLIAAYLTARFRHLAPSDAPAREQILGNFDRLERMFADGSFRGCPYVNAVTEPDDPGVLTSRRRRSKLSPSRGNADSPPGANRSKTSASKLCFTDSVRGSHGRADISKFHIDKRSSVRPSQRPASFDHRRLPLAALPARTPSVPEGK